jgi:hypothetical protein
LPPGSRFRARLFAQRMRDLRARGRRELEQRGRQGRAAAVVVIGGEVVAFGQRDIGAEGQEIGA